MTGKIGSTHGNSCPSRDDSRKRDAASLLLPARVHRSRSRETGFPKAARSCFIASSVASTVLIGRHAFGARQLPWKTSMSVCLLPQPPRAAPVPRLRLLPQQPQSAWNARSHDGIEHPAKASAAMRSRPRWSSTGYSMAWAACSSCLRGCQTESLRGLHSSLLSADLICSMWARS